MKNLLLLWLSLFALVVCSTAKCRFRRHREWSSCENGVHNLTWQLRPGSDVDCPETQVRIKPCAQGCHYRPSERFGDCDLATETRTRKLTLKRADEGAVCADEVNETLSCTGIECIYAYDQAEWSECDATNNTATISLPLKFGNVTQCDAVKTTIRRCRGSRNGPRRGPPPQRNGALGKKNGGNGQNGNGTNNNGGQNGPRRGPPPHGDGTQGQNNGDDGQNDNGTNNNGDQNGPRRDPPPQGGSQNNGDQRGSPNGPGGPPRGGNNGPQSRNGPGGGRPDGSGPRPGPRG